MSRIKLCILMIFFVLRSAAQFPTNFQLSLQNEDSIIKSNIYALDSSNQFIINNYKYPSNEKYIIFFLGTTKDDRNEYYLNALSFLKEKFVQYKPSKIKIYFFNSEIINHSINLSFPDTIIKFNEFRCFFINYDSALIYRASKTRIAPQFKVGKIGSQGNVYQVSLVTSTCGGSSFSKVIDDYSLFIHEVLRPTYSDHEKLEQRIKSLENKINILENRLREQSLQRNEFYASCLDEGDILRVMANQSIRSKKKTKNKTK